MKLANDGLTHKVEQNVNELSFHDSKIRELEKTLKNELYIIRQKDIQRDIYERRMNLLIFGVRESLAWETNEQCLNNVFLCNSLGPVFSYVVIYIIYVM